MRLDPVPQSTCRTLLGWGALRPMAACSQLSDLQLPLAWAAEVSSRDAGDRPGNVLGPGSGEETVAGGKGGPSPTCPSWEMSSAGHSWTPGPAASACAQVCVQGSTGSRSAWS